MVTNVSTDVEQVSNICIRQKYHKWIKNFDIH